MFPWKGLNNQIKIDAEPKLKKMITEYNAPNEVAFLQIELGSYKVMALDTISTTQPGDHDIDPVVLAPKKEAME